MEKIKVNLIGEDGNIFNLIGIVSEALCRNGMEEQAEEMQNKIYSSNSYDEALQIIMDYVDIE